MPAPRPRGRQPIEAPARARPGPRLRAPAAGRFATRGQPAAVAAVERMLRHGAPQALLLVGPASVGKTTLALDLAAGILCHADDPDLRPCGSCRSCRLIDAGAHQDLHRLAPEGPGLQVRIGDHEDPDPGTVRHLLRELARLPVEGAHRVAIVEAAHRLNEDAQNALLKTLEEPPAGATLILCADEPERLLPTVRSRVAVLRLGPVGVRVVEGVLAEHGVEPPRSAQLARLADGRPGLAITLAAAPEAVAAREELARSLLDLAALGTADRLVAGRDLLARAADLARIGGTPAVSPGPGSGAVVAGSTIAGATGDPEAEAGPRPARGTPAERRQAAASLIATWTAVARDLAVTAAGAGAAARDTALLDDLRAVAAAVAPGACTAFLGRLVRAAELLDANANPELLVDTLVLAWPRAHAHAGTGASARPRATGPFGGRQPAGDPR
jgi:DNA polymerase-3 subunit delta'